ncbi:HNH endonuclease [Janthinobacterium sp. Mn2066]|uniref:HNH endonuclease n=1 Tax=Janthinobacterium sp. Mn2066 TaxID=3395264 RepID=UPI003BD443DE
MMRLENPKADFATTLDTCIVGITGNNAFLQKMKDGKVALLQAGTDYVDHGGKGTLSSIQPISTYLSKDPIVVGALAKSELVNLYEYYFRNEEKASRTLYDRLLSSADDDCPFCGGIGRPKNLDHFLPKAHFPQYSVFPQNLVPSCRDCNMDGKATAFATRPEDQLIQPYVDNDHFFNEQWIYAECVLNAANMPKAVRYFVKPPEGWDGISKLRVQKHFDDFGLGSRYAIQTAKLLKTSVDQIVNSRNLGLENESIRKALLEPGVNNAPFINHWMRGMYQALSDYLERL